MPKAGSQLPFLVARALALVTLIACTGCWTPALWRGGGGGTRVEVVEVIGAVTDGQTGRPALVLECEGEGLARGKWYAVVPLEEGGALDASLDQRWGGLTIGDLRGLARAPASRASLGAADKARSLRERVRVSRDKPREELTEIDARILPHGRDHVLVAYWPPGERAEVPVVVRARWLDEEAARAFIQKILGDDRAWREYEAHANLVEVVHRPDWSQARPQHIALLPRTLLRPLPQRIGATSAAVALTPLALAGDAVGLALGVVTAPIWIPAFYLTMWLNPPFNLDRPPPEPEWHAPMSLPPE